MTGPANPHPGPPPEPNMHPAPAQPHTEAPRPETASYDPTAQQGFQVPGDYQVPGGYQVHSDYQAPAGYQIADSSLPVPAHAAIPGQPAAAAAQPALSHQHYQHQEAPYQQAPYQQAPYQEAQHQQALRAEPAQPGEVPPEPAAPVEGAPIEPVETNGAENSLSMGSVRLAVIALIALAGGFLVMTELGIGRTGSAGTAADSSVLAVVASDLVNASKKDAGASDAIGGYLPGVGIVLTVHLDELESGEMNGWVASNLDPFADRISALPDGEAVVVTVDVAEPAPLARVWSLQPEDITRTEGWERLVSPATFIDASTHSSVADDNAPATLASAASDDSTEPDSSEPAPTNDSGSDSGSDSDSDAEAGANDGDDADGATQDDPADVDADTGDGEGGDAGTELEGPSGDGPFYENDLWSPIFGSWTLADGVYSQSDATGYGYSSEYIGETPDQFNVGVDMRAPFGDMNAGIIYGQPDRGSKNGSTVVDITGEGTYLRWGSYDPDSGEWAFIGGAPIDPPLVADAWTRMDLAVRSDQTEISLNGEYVATIDSPAPGGVALVVSVANIEFKDFALTGVGSTDGEPAGDDGDAPPEDPDNAEDPDDGSDGAATDDTDDGGDTDPDADTDVEVDGGDLDVIEDDDGDGFDGGFVGGDGDGIGDGDGTGDGDGGLVFEVFDDALLDWQLLSGSWTASDGLLHQNNGDGYDQMIHFLDERQTNYRVEVKLRAKEDSRFSGGLLFNVDRTGVRSDSYVFDIVNDGNDVRWATYDSNGVFSYIGGVRIADGFDPEEWHEVGVEVRDGRAQFFIDGNEIGASRDVGESGHVGMVTSLAAMEFTDFVVTPIEVDG